MAPQFKYSVELFFSFNSSTLLRVNFTVEYSLVLSVVPDSTIAELSSVTVVALCIEIFLHGASTVP